MNERQVYTLRDLLEIKYGKDHKKLGDGIIPVFGSGGLMRYADTALYGNESILIPRKGSLNNIMYVDTPFWTVDTMFYTRPNKKLVNTKFLYYLLTQIDFANMNVGSAVPSMTVETLNELEVEIPPLPEQQAIAEVLSSLDDKIDLLHRNNKTLEEMAGTLYRKYILIDNEYAEEIELVTVFDFLEGPGIRNWQYTESGTPFINIRLIDNGEINLKSANYVSNEEAGGKYSHFLLKEKDMIVSTSGTLGKNAIVRNYHLPLMLNTSVIRFRPRNPTYYSYLYQYLNSAEFKEALESLSCGSVQSNFGPTHLKSMKIRFPSPEPLMSFIQFCDPLYEKLNHNYNQINLLKQLRDELLTKLMSGSVRVKSISHELSVL